MKFLDGQARDNPKSCILPHVWLGLAWLCHCTTHFRAANEFCMNSTTFQEEAAAKKLIIEWRVVDVSFAVVVAASMLSHRRRRRCRRRSL